METLVIGKPAVNIYLPLQEYPQEGDLFIIKSKNESVGNIGATSACLLSKWKMSTHFTGVIGNDGYGEKIKDTFKTYNVDSRYMETDFESSTAVNYNTLNVKTGIVTKVIYNDFESQLKKYKYDFIPDFAIIDGTDLAGAHALLNNNATVKTVFYGRVGDKDTIPMSKRCTWSVVTEKFASMMTKEEADGTAEGYVNLYQKIVDVAGLSNYIVILNNKKILYCVDGKVKMLPEMKINMVDSSSFDSIFVGALSFALMNNIGIDDAIKFANTAGAISLTKIGEEPAIPDIHDVLDNCGLRSVFGLDPVKKSVDENDPMANGNIGAMGVVNSGNSEVNQSNTNAFVNQTPQVENQVPNTMNGETNANPVQSAEASIEAMQAATNPINVVNQPQQMSEPVNNNNINTNV